MNDVEMNARPVVRVDPAVRFGRPHIKGVSTEAIAGMIYAGESPETVCYEYDLTRHELLVPAGTRAPTAPFASSGVSGQTGWRIGDWPVGTSP